MNTDNPKSEIRNPKFKAVFLDRDGTICEDVSYLARVDDLKLFPFAAESVRLLNENNFLAILITNQSGIARGFFDENALQKIHEKLVLELAEQNAKLDAIYFCPHYPDDNCDCRKPKTGMIEQATKDFPVDLENSWMVGDKAIDIETGFNAGTKSALVLTGYGQKETEKLKRNPDFVAENLLEVVERIIKK
jgi:D,D-heptose 1,7-bisphosphate phosphatase